MDDFLILMALMIFVLWWLVVVLAAGGVFLGMWSLIKTAIELPPRQILPLIDPDHLTPGRLIGGGLWLLLVAGLLAHFVFWLPAVFWQRLVIYLLLLLVVTAGCWFLAEYIDWRLRRWGALPAKTSRRG